MARTCPLATPRFRNSFQDKLLLLHRNTKKPFRRPDKGVQSSVPHELLGHRKVFRVLRQLQSGRAYSELERQGGLVLQHVDLLDTPRGRPRCAAYEQDKTLMVYSKG